MLSSELIQTTARPGRRGNDGALGARRQAFAFAIAFALVAIFFTGCQTTKPVKLPVVVGENPTTSELLDAINKNSEKIQALYTTDAYLSVSNEPGSANCRVFFLRPNKMRLIGSATMVGRVVDAGCDGDKFWFWSHFYNDKELYSCKLSEYDPNTLGDAIPIDPSWFPEVFGVVEIKQDDLSEEPKTQSDGTILISAKKTRPDGVYLKRIYVEPRTAAIKRQDIQNPKGETILAVECVEQQYLEEQAVVMPRKLEIRKPGTSGALFVNLGSPTLNDPSKFDDSVFQTPTDLNAKVVDLSAKKTTAQSAPTAMPATTATPPAKVARADESPNWRAPTNATAPVKAGDSGLVAFPNGQSVVANNAPAKRPDVVMPAQKLVNGPTTITAPTEWTYGPNDHVAQTNPAPIQPAATAQNVAFEPAMSPNAQANGVPVPSNNVASVPQTARLVNSSATQTANPAVFAPPSLTTNATLVSQPVAQPVAPSVNVQSASQQSPQIAQPAQQTLTQPAPIAQPDPSYVDFPQTELAVPPQSAASFEQTPVSAPQASFDQPPVVSPTNAAASQSTAPETPEIDDDFPLIPF